MEVIQWIVAAGTAVFVATVGFFQWQTTQQKAVLDLFDRRHEIYSVVRKAVGQIVSQSQGYDQKQEVEFLSAKERAYFFFGDDIVNYLESLRIAILDVRSADVEMGGASGADLKTIIERRRKALNQVEDFYKIGQPMFGRYMRFDQTARSCSMQRWHRAGF